MIFTESTQNFWANRSNYDLYISEEVIIEIDQGNHPFKEKILESASEIQLLPFDNLIVETADFYIKNYLMPRKLSGDAIHLAYASIFEIDILLTWNFNHLANIKKTRHIETINKKLDLNTPKIISPLQMVDKEDLS